MGILRSRHICERTALIPAPEEEPARNTWFKFKATSSLANTFSFAPSAADDAEEEDVTVLNRGQPQAHPSYPQSKPGTGVRDAVANDNSEIMRDVGG
ncbi:hypothetical protein WAI453_010494 [Rhynchosporium graminicola]